MTRQAAEMTKARKALLTLVFLALLAVVLQSLVFSGASFTAAKGNSGNAFAAGTLTHVNSQNGTYVISAADLRPGQSSQGTLTITGGGDVAGTYTLSKASVVDTPASPGLSSALTLLIEDTTGTPVTLFSGTVAAFTTLSLGSIGPGTTRQYRFTLTLPTASAVPSLQGASMTLGLQFTGVSP
jgi:spore coat-associated protein N